ncbi:MAG TPA: hypothetical protein VN691_03300 [Steroidobacteraceae bacterium]|nr:hypothetical protein [Steroidobacteraceae bacterium]
MSLSKSDLARLMAAPCVRLRPPAFDLSAHESDALKASLGAIDRLRTSARIDEPDADDDSAASALSEQLEIVRRRAVELETALGHIASELRALERRGLTLTLSAAGARSHMMTMPVYLTIERLDSRQRCTGRSAGQ